MIKPRVMPNATEEERAVIGYCLDVPGGYEECRVIVQPKHLYQPFHKQIWDAMEAIYGRRLHPDHTSVFNEMLKRKQLSASELTALVDFKKCTKRNLMNNCKIIVERFIHRGRIEIANKILESAYDGFDDCFDAISADRKALAELEPSVSKIVDASELVVPVIEDVEAAMRGETRSMYIGFRDFDQDYAFEPSEVVIIGADSGTGKTAFTLRVVKNMRRMYPHMPFIFNSLEMKDRQLIARDMASSIGISQMRMRTGERIDKNHIAAMVNLEAGYQGIKIVRCKTHDELEQKVKQVKKSLGLDDDDPVGVVTDYIQLMIGKGGNRAQEVSNIATTGQSFAKENNALYFMLSQLNRASGSGRPNVKHLKESGDIEAVADWIFLGYNPWKNGEKTYENGDSTEGILEWEGAKVRFGRAGDIKKLMMTNSGLITDMPDPNAHKYGGDDFPDPRRVVPIVRNPSEPNTEQGSGGDFLPF